MKLATDTPHLWRSAISKALRFELMSPDTHRYKLCSLFDGIENLQAIGDEEKPN